MNRIYKTIWNESIRAWVAVHENAAACGKSTRSTRRRVARRLLALGVAATGFTAVTPGAHAQVNPDNLRSVHTGIGRRSPFASSASGGARRVRPGGGPPAVSRHRVCLPAQ